MKKTYLALSLILMHSASQALPLPEQNIKAYECERCSNLSHELLKDSWLLANKPLQMANSNKQQSYGYKQQVSSQELEKGIPLTLLGKGAIIRVSPINSTSAPKLSLKTPGQQTLSLAEASSLYSEKEALEPDFSPEKDTIAQIKPELGKGRFILKGLNKSPEQVNYMLSVLDKFSLTHLDVETKALFYHYGDTVKADIYLDDQENDYELDDIDAFLVSPKGNSERMQIKQISPQHFEASYQLSSEQSDNGENWYVKVAAEREDVEGSVRRSGQAAFSYSIPSASLTAIKQTNPLSFSAKVKVATASRYSLQGVLLKKNNKLLNAIETAQTGIWLEPGVHTIEFTFDNSTQLAEDQLYLGYLRLIDYGQLKMVYRHDQAIQLSQLVE